MAQEIVLTILRWLHIIAGVFWLGFAYVLLFAVLPALAGLATDVRQAIASTVQRRMFTFLRWGSLLAWLTGIVLLGMLYHAGGRMFNDSAAGWNAAAGISVLAVFLAFPLYDLLARMSFFSDIRRLGALTFLATIALVEVMSGPAGMGYSAVLIHIGAMFGTIMVANVWMRIWPAQRAAIAAQQEGRPADESRLQDAVRRTRHNAYLSVPLLWTMLGQHSVIPGAFSNLWFYGIIVASWGLVAHLEARSRRFAS
jgi:uncharacterized membrane protein